MINMQFTMRKLPYKGVMVLKLLNFYECAHLMMMGCLLTVFTMYTHYLMYVLDDTSVKSAKKFCVSSVKVKY